MHCCFMILRDSIACHEKGLHVYQAAQAEDAFRYFRGGNKTGKAILDFREDGQTSVDLDPGDCYTSRVSTKSVGLTKVVLKISLLECCRGPFLMIHSS